MNEHLVRCATDEPLIVSLKLIQKIELCFFFFSIKKQYFFKFELGKFGK